MKIFWGIIVAVSLFLASNILFIVKQTEQALVFQFGEIVRVITTPGLKIKAPFIQNVMVVSKQVLNVQIDDKEVIAKDQKRLIVNAFAKYQVTNPQKFYQTLRDEYGAKSRIAAILDSSLRQILGDVTLSSLLTTERTQVMQKIQDVLTKQTQNFGIQVVDVRILRADLPDENSKATYERMITDRRQQAARFRAEGQEESDKIMADANRQYEVILAEADRESEITRGQGEAQASATYAEAFGKDPEFFDFYRTLQSYRNSLKGDKTRAILSPSNGFLSHFVGGK